MLIIAGFLALVEYSQKIKCNIRISADLYRISTVSSRRRLVVR